MLEPAGAAALAAVLTGAVPIRNGDRVAVILSGGNVAPDRLGALLAVGRADRRAALMDRGRRDEPARPTSRRPPDATAAGVGACRRSAADAPSVGPSSRRRPRRPGPAPRSPAPAAPVVSDAVLAIPLGTRELVRQSLDLLTRRDAGLRGASFYIGLMLLVTVAPIVMFGASRRRSASTLFDPFEPDRRCAGSLGLLAIAARVPRLPRRERRGARRWPRP